MYIYNCITTQLRLEKLKIFWLHYILKMKDKSFKGFLAQNVNAVATPLALLAERAVLARNDKVIAGDFTDSN